MFCCCKKLKFLVFLKKNGEITSGAKLGGI